MCVMQPRLALPPCGSSGSVCSLSCQLIARCAASLSASAATAAAATTVAGTGDCKLAHRSGVWTRFSCQKRIWLGQKISCKYKAKAKGFGKVTWLSGAAKGLVVRLECG